MKTITEIPVPTRPEHTPGPWTVDNQYIHGPDGIRFLAVAGDGAGQANARLIAAAPTLLEALAGCADALREAGKDFAQANKLAVRPNLYELHERAARAAIAKAKGGAA